MQRYTKKSKNGFTIIEIMIVLAIAALIMLIIFLAVPALQRSARNTQRKNDAAAVSGAVANFISNNGGTLPDGGGGTPGGTRADASDPNTVDICSTSGCSGAGFTFETAKLGYYTPANITVTTAANPAVTTTTLIIDDQYGCNASLTGPGAKNTRTAAILYEVENTGSGTEQCVEQ